jgi:hypothetical protein
LCAIFEKEMTQDIITLKDTLKSFLNLRLTSLLASNVRLQAGQKWYDCFSIKLRHIPSFGHLKLYYEFGDYDGPIEFSHQLKSIICAIDDKDDSLGDKHYDFKVDFGNDFEVKKVKLLGQLISFEENGQMNVLEEINIIHYQSDNFELLIRPEFSTSRLLFCIDRQEIQDFIKKVKISTKDNVTFDQIEISV